MSKKTASGLGTIRFVGLIHEELVEASQALHALCDSDQDELQPALIRSALNACFAALWHAQGMTGDDCSFVVVRRPKSQRVQRMLKERTFPKAKP